jgi:hypothetical protein
MQKSNTHNLRVFYKTRTTRSKYNIDFDTLSKYSKIDEAFFNQFEIKDLTLPQQLAHPIATKPLLMALWKSFV